MSIMMCDKCGELRDSDFIEFEDETCEFCWEEEPLSAHDQWANECDYQYELNRDLKDER